jgi:hypothetical protein
VIVVYARIKGHKKRQTLKFLDGCMPRFGEFVRLGKKFYRIAEVTHCFTRRDLPNPLIGETHYIDIPGTAITLVEV